jgi:hypothetical protein
MKTRNNKSDFDLFYKLPKILFQHSTILNTSTGEHIELKMSDVMLYTYMLDQFTSYKKSGNKFFESILAIANKCSHLSESTVKRSLNQLKSAGLIEIGEKKGRGRWASNLYTVHSISDLLRDGSISFPVDEIETPDDIIRLPQEPAQPVTSEQGLAFYFMQYSDENKFASCSGITEAMRTFHQLLETKRGKAIKIPPGFIEYINKNHPQVYDQWEVPF